MAVEDDCESIGRQKEMVHPNTRPELKAKVKSIVVKEFGGFDHLPDKIAELGLSGMWDGPWSNLTGGRHQTTL